MFTQTAEHVLPLALPEEFQAVLAAAPRVITPERGGARFRPGKVQRAREPLLGYVLSEMHVEAALVPDRLLRTHLQPEIGEEAYDAGAGQLKDYFRRELDAFVKDPALDPLGRRLLEVFFDGGHQGNYKDVWAAA